VPLHPKCRGCLLCDDAGSGLSASLDVAGLGAAGDGSTATGFSMTPVQYELVLNVLHTAVVY